MMVERQNPLCAQHLHQNPKDFALELKYSYLSQVLRVTVACNVFNLPAWSNPQ